MLANALEFDSGVIPVIPWKTITVTNNNDSGPGSLRNAVAAAQDKPTEYFNGSNGVLTVAQITFSGAGEQDILTGGGYSEASPYFIIDTGNGDDQFLGTTRDRLIGTLGGNDTISYAMVEGTTTDRLIDTLGGNDSFGSDGADTLRASYFGGNSTSGSAQNNGDIIVSGNGADLINGGYSELHPIFEIITLPPRPAYPRPSFTDTIDGELFSSGASPVEVTLFLPAVQSALETASRLSGFITGGNGRDSI